MDPQRLDNYARICTAADFADERFMRTARELAPTLAAAPPHRKLWEWVTGAMFLEDAGILNTAAAILDVGAGTEAILFWLARRVRTVTAIDIYGEGEFSGGEAERDFLHEPERWAPYAYPRDRLIVSKQDARSLDFADCTFDAVVSFSSIEHMGGRNDVKKAAAEIGRVLKPGGLAFIATELRLRTGVLDRVPLLALKRAVDRRFRRSRLPPRRPPLRPSGDVFTLDELRECIIGPSLLHLTGPLTLDPTAVRLARQTAVRSSGASAGELHLALRSRGSVFTSVSLPLRKL
jgi:SAM-dependent methyltransferase